MRVLHVISSNGMYGAEAVILQLARAMDGRDHSGSSCLAVFAHKGQPQPELYQAACRAGLEAVQIPCSGQLDPQLGSRLRSIVEATGADVVHAHGYKADIYASLAYLGSGRRPALVSTCHTWYDNDRAVRAYGALDRGVLRFFDEVVAVSAAVASRLRKAGVRPERIALIRNGIAAAAGDGSLEGQRSQTARGENLRVGLVGRLAPEKGVDVFLKAVAQVAALYPKAEFVVAGDGPDRGALDNLMAELKLHGRAVLLGRQADMPAIYESLDVLVSASRLEGLPIALLEGMQTGLPVVATAVGEVPEVVVDGQTGILVAPEDPAALAGAIGRMLGDAGLRERCGRAGQARVRQEFSANRMAADYTEVYRRALDRRRSLVPVLGKGAG